MSPLPYGPDVGTRILRRCDEPALISAPSKGVTRLYLTPEHRRAADLVIDWMTDAGMEAYMDAVGNVVGRYDSEGGKGPYLILGSHFDTVVDGGKYDGALGVVTAIDCVARLHEAGRRLPFGVEVVAFGDEEGTRFSTALAGSSGVVGEFGDVLASAIDQDSIRLADALITFGLNPEWVGKAAHSRDDVLGYVELHIEQGPVLEAEGLPIGVVTSIIGQTRARIAFQGAPNHAGTVPMRLRRDPLLAAAELAIEVEKAARDSADAVATVGQFQAYPGAMNVIPGQVVMSVDLRAAADEVRESAFASIVAAAKRIAADRGVDLEIDKLIDLSACPCSPMLVDQLAAAVEAQGVRVYKLPSGAGHDGMAMAHLTDIGMLFVRCKGGVSHSPDESVDIGDVRIAAEALFLFVSKFRAV
jgi:allantoate deiminase